MAGTQYPHPVGKQLIEGCKGVSNVPCFAPEVGEVVACRQGVGMIRAEDPELIRQQLFKDNNGARCLTDLAKCGGEVIPGSERAVRELTSFSSLVLRKAGWLEVRRRATGAAV